MKRKFFTVKKRFVLILIAVVLFFVLSTLFVLFGSNRFDYHSNYFAVGAEFTDAKIIQGDTDIVRFAGLHTENDELVFEIESVHPGKTTAQFTCLTVFNEDNYTAYESPPVNIEVLPTGTMFCKVGNGITFHGVSQMVWIFTILCVIIAATLIFSFFEAFKKARFSYSMIAYGGLGMYFTALCVLLLYDLLNRGFSTLSGLAWEMLFFFDLFFLVLTPVIGIFLLLMSVSNLWLIFHEGFRPVNLLGIAISVVWVIGLSLVMVFYLFSNTYFSSFTYRLSVIVKSIMTYVMIYFECMLLSTGFSAFLSTVYRPKPPKDYIIILGCAIRKDGTLTPLLRGRVDKALRFERAQFQKTGKHAFFVPSGGQGADEVISEAEAMKRYLMEQGVPEEQILKEDKSVNTFQNMQFSGKVIRNHAADLADKSIAFSTTNYHVFRGYVLAQKNGFYAQGLSAKTKFYFFPNAFLREFIGMLWDKKIHHIIILAGIIVFLLGLVPLT